MKIPDGEWYHSIQLDLKLDESSGGIRIQAKLPCIVCIGWFPQDFPALYPRHAVQALHYCGLPYLNHGPPIDMAGQLIDIVKWVKINLI
jgi:hypothetical protein